eukprot:750800-Hanusia_phi.AAC.1
MVEGTIVVHEDIDSLAACMFLALIQMFAQQHATEAEEVRWNEGRGVKGMGGEGKWRRGRGRGRGK